MNQMREDLMGCLEYEGYKRPQIEMISRLFHLFKALELSNKHGSWRNKKYLGESEAAEFFYYYFTPHNKG